MPPAGVKLVVGASSSAAGTPTALEAKRVSTIRGEKHTRSPTIRPVFVPNPPRRELPPPPRKSDCWHPAIAGVEQTGRPASPTTGKRRSREKLVRTTAGETDAI